MYDIRINSLGTVYLSHAPENANKIVRIAEDMAQNGWKGRPAIMLDAGDHKIALNATHRLCAAIGQDIEIDTVMLPDDLTADEWDSIERANDDDDLLAALEEINESRDGEIDEIVAVMREEVAQNK